MPGEVFAEDFAAGVSVLWWFGVEGEIVGVAGAVFACLNAAGRICQLDECTLELSTLCRGKCLREGM
jgi:hypothetical protein